MMDNVYNPQVERISGKEFQGNTSERNVRLIPKYILSDSWISSMAPIGPEVTKGTHALKNTWDILGENDDRALQRAKVARTMYCVGILRCDEVTFLRQTLSVHEDGATGKRIPGDLF